MKKLMPKDVVHHYYADYRDKLPRNLRLWPRFWRNFLKGLGVKESELKLSSTNEALEFMAFTMEHLLLQAEKTNWMLTDIMVLDTKKVKMFTEKLDIYLYHKDTGVGVGPTVFVRDRKTKELKAYHLEDLVSG